MNRSVFNTLCDESASMWLEKGAVLLRSCDINTGLVYPQEDLPFTVHGFSDVLTYVIEEGSEVHFPDQSIDFRNEKGRNVRSLDSCTLFGAVHTLSLTAVDGLFKATRSPSVKT